MENGADELLRRAAPDRATHVRGRRVDDRAHRPAGRRDRHARGRVPGPIDDGLREGRRPDRPAPARRRARRPAKHGLPGHDRLRRPAPGGSRLHGRRRVLPGADRRGPRARGAPHAAADRRRRRRHAPPTGPTALFGHLDREDGPDDVQGSRARQALHEHVAVHEVRRREPVPDDRRPGRRRLHERPAGRSARTIRAPRTCPGPGFAAGPCLFKDTMQLAAFTADHFPLGQAAMQVNEGLPAYIVSALERRYGGLQGKTVGILGHGLQGRIGRHPGVAELQAAQAARVGRRAGPRHGPVRHRTIGSSRSTASSRRATSWSSARRTRRTASLQIGGKDVVDVWGALGGGIQL